MSVTQHGQTKLRQAIRRGWTPQDHRGPCRYLREHRDWLRMRRKGRARP